MNGGEAGIDRQITRTCAIVRKFGSPYLDRELEPVLQRAVSAHVAVCHACLDRMVDAAQFDEAIRASLAAVPAGSRSFWAGVERHLGR